MENTTTAPCTDETTQIIAETSACSAAISTAIQRQNEVLLSSCQALIDQTLKALFSLKNLESLSPDSSVSKSMEQLQSKAVQTLNQSFEALPNNLATEVSIDKAIVDSLKNQSLKSFIDSSAILWANSVSAQQQFTNLAQAATTQAIMTIVSVAASEIPKK
jgi:hypothetical protein